jgi:hypothetical protein
MSETARSNLHDAGRPGIPQVLIQTIVVAIRTIQNSWSAQQHQPATYLNG